MNVTLLTYDINLYSLIPSLRKLAYHYQRTGNPRLEAEALKMHESLDEMCDLLDMEKVSE